MEGFIIFIIGVSVASIISSFADSLKYKNYRIREYDADKKACERICRSCRRKWSSDKNGVLKAKYDNLDRFIKISLEERFEYKDYLNYIGYDEKCSECDYYEDCD